MANLLLTLVAAGEDGHGGPEALWLQDYQWVSVAMLILIGIIIYMTYYSGDKGVSIA